MSNEGLRHFYSAIQARSNAHFAMRSKLPGRTIYFKAELRRAIRAWKRFAEARRAEQ